MSSSPVSKRPRRVVRGPVQSASALDVLPVELLESIFALAGPQALLALNATSKNAGLREALDLAWSGVTESVFGHVQLTFNESRWWFRRLLLDAPAGAPVPGSSAQVSCVPSPSGKRKTRLADFFGPKHFEKYLSLQLHSRLFRGTSCTKSRDISKGGVLRPRLDSIAENDEVRYFNLSFPLNIGKSLYIEITVDANHDNLSLSLVDFAEGGVCSVTFSPDAGAIIKERKVKERPRQVRGSFAYALATLEPQELRGTRFFGKVGLFVKAGKLAFLRQGRDQDWQSSGLCVQLKDEFDATVLTPCIAFRDYGDYGVEISRVSEHPPVAVEENKALLENTAWQPITWSHADQ